MTIGMSRSLFDDNKTNSQDVTQVELLGGNSPYHPVDVVLEDGIRKLQTKSTVIVEEIFGQDGYSDSWFRIENTGTTGATFTLTIGATSNDPTSVDIDRPQYQKVFTTLVGEVGSETTLCTRIVTELNADTNFKAYFKATKVKDNRIVHIASKYRGEFWETDTFSVVTTDAASITLGFSDLKRRGKPTSLSTDPSDPRVGILGISGSVVSTPAALGDIFIANALSTYPTGSASLNVNGSVTPQYFYIRSDSTHNTYVNRIRFYGRDNGIKFGQMLSQTTLTNGIQIKIKSEDITTTLPLLKTTDDFKNKFAIGGDFSLHVQAGGDSFNATFDFESPFPLMAIGTYSTDDYIEIKIQDNLSTIYYLEFISYGFKKDI